MLKSVATIEKWRERIATKRDQIFCELLIMQCKCASHYWEGKEQTRLSLVLVYSVLWKTRASTELYFLL